MDKEPCVKKFEGLACTFENSLDFLNYNNPTHGVSSLKAGSHDPIFDPFFQLALFQLIEILFRVSNFFEAE